MLMITLINMSKKTETVEDIKEVTIICHVSPSNFNVALYHFRTLRLFSNKTIILSKLWRCNQFFKSKINLGIIASGLATRGSRFGQPSILATTGRLGPNTESASLSISSSVPTAPPSGFVISRPSYGGSRFGKPSILASTGQLGPDTSSVPIFISSPSSGFKVSRHSSVGSRFGQPSILASTGQLSQDTDSASLSISSTRPSRSPGSSKLSIVSVSPWTTVSSSPSSQTINNYSGSRYHIIMF